MSKEQHPGPWAYKYGFGLSAVADSNERMICFVSNKEQAQPILDAKNTQAVLVEALKLAKAAISVGVFTARGPSLAEVGAAIDAALASVEVTK